MSSEKRRGLKGNDGVIMIGKILLEFRSLVVTTMYRAEVLSGFESRSRYTGDWDKSNKKNAKKIAG